MLEEKEHILILELCTLNRALLFTDFVKLVAHVQDAKEPTTTSR